MRKPIWTISLMAATCLMASAGQVVRLSSHDATMDRWGRDFDVRHKITFTGRVTGIERTRSAAGQESEVTLLVRNFDGNGTATVDIGPAWFVDHQSAKIKVCDMVQVTGSKVIVDGHGLIIGSMIRLGKQGGPVLALRRLSGRAYWVGTEMAQNNTPPTGANVITGTFNSFRPYTLDNVQYQSAILDTNNGQMLIDLGPDWYYGRQNLNYQIGQGVSVIVGNNPITIGPNSNVASSYSIYNGSNIYNIRNADGTPTYYWTPVGG